MNSSSNNQKIQGIEDKGSNSIQIPTSAKEIIDDTTYDVSGIFGNPGIEVSNGFDEGNVELEQTESNESVLDRGKNIKVIPLSEENIIKETSGGNDLNSSINSKNIPEELLKSLIQNIKSRDTKNNSGKFFEKFTPFLNYRIKELKKKLLNDLNEESINTLINSISYSYSKSESDIYKLVLSLFDHLKEEEEIQKHENFRKEEAINKVEGILGNDVLSDPIYLSNGYTIFKRTIKKEDGTYSLTVITIDENNNKKETKPIKAENFDEMSKLNKEMTNTTIGFIESKGNIKVNVVQEAEFKKLGFSKEIGKEQSYKKKFFSNGAYIFISSKEVENWKFEVYGSTCYKNGNKVKSEIIIAESISDLRDKIDGLEETLSGHLINEYPNTKEITESEYDEIHNKGIDKTGNRKKILLSELRKLLIILKVNTRYNKSPKRIKDAQVKIKNITNELGNYMDRMQVGLLKTDIKKLQNQLESEYGGLDNQINIDDIINKYK